MPSFARLLPWTLPALYLAGALLAATLGKREWRMAAWTTRGALGLSLLAAVLGLSGLAPTTFPAAGAASLFAVLVAFLGWIIGDYARRYLQGEPGQRRFVIAYLATLASVSTVVVSGHLAIIIAAWSASSIGLHHLLTFYRDRPAAVIVAHKKFLASRLAEICLVIAAVLLQREWGTLDLAAIASHARDAQSLPGPVNAAAVLIAIGVLLKSAQLPLHGWLIQVMEAPTPVSALLHAGIVNLGGYVLIRLAPLMAGSAAAQTLLVIVGSLTAVVAGLVMLTRITIKVRLAWSTVSQMGFMVMECGLGLYDLAFLHLLAHSLYKAYAFLTAGEAVRDSQVRQLLSAAAAGAGHRGAGAVVIALAVSVLITAGSAWSWHQFLGLPAIPWVAIALLAGGLATLLWQPGPAGGMNWGGLARLAAAAQLYFIWHWGLSAGLGLPAASAHPLLSLWVLLVFAGLYAAQAHLFMRPTARGPGSLYDWVYSGFYLDERFTRLTFRLWPVRELQRRGEHA